MASERCQLYVDGRWVDPLRGEKMPVINPATEEVFRTVALASADDVAVAVAAARRAFDGTGYDTTPNGTDIL